MPQQILQKLYKKEPDNIYCSPAKTGLQKKIPMASPSVKAFTWAVFPISIYAPRSLLLACRMIAISHLRFSRASYFLSELSCLPLSVVAESTGSSFGRLGCVFCRDFSTKVSSYGLRHDLDFDKYEALRLAEQLVSIARASNHEKASFYDLAVTLLQQRLSVPNSHFKAYFLSFSQERSMLRFWNRYPKWTSPFPVAIAERLDEDTIHMQGLLLLLVRLPMQFAFTVEFRATAWHNVTENSETPIAQSSVHNKGRSLPLIPRASFVKFCLWGC